jgi:hypothetical protein
MTTAREKLYEEMVAMVATPAGPTSETEIRKTMTRYRVQTKPGVDIAPGTTARDALGDRLLELWRTQGADVKAKIGTSIDEFRMQLKGSSSPPHGAASARRAFLPTPGVRASVPAVEDDDHPGRDPAPRGTDVRQESRPASRLAPGSALRDRRVATEPRRGGLGSGLGDGPLGRPTALHPSHEVEALGVGEPPTAAMRARAGRAGAEPVAGGPRKRGRTRGECPKCHSMGVVLARSYSGDEYFSCIYCGWQAYKPSEDDDPNASLAVRLLGHSPSETSRE